MESKMELLIWFESIFASLFCELNTRVKLELVFHEYFRGAYKFK